MDGSPVMRYTFHVLVSLNQYVQDLNDLIDTDEYLADTLRFHYTIVKELTRWKSTTQSNNKGLESRKLASR